MGKMEFPPIAAGHKRQWARCRTCGRISYYDYVPYSFSTAIMDQPCGHGAGDRDYGMTAISEGEAMASMTERSTKALKDAAPDLLAALKASREVVAKESGDNGPDYSSRMLLLLAEIDAAISKAEG